MRRWFFFLLMLSSLIGRLSFGEGPGDDKKNPTGDDRKNPDRILLLPQSRPTIGSQLTREQREELSVILRRSIVALAQRQSKDPQFNKGMVLRTDQVVNDAFCVKFIPPSGEGAADFLEMGLKDLEPILKKKISEDPRFQSDQRFQFQNIQLTMKKKTALDEKEKNFHPTIVADFDMTVTLGGEELERLLGSPQDVKSSVTINSHIQWELKLSPQVLETDWISSIFADHQEASIPIEGQTITFSQVKTEATGPIKFPLFVISSGKAEFPGSTTISTNPHTLSLKWNENSGKPSGEAKIYGLEISNIHSDSDKVKRTADILLGEWIHRSQPGVDLSSLDLNQRVKNLFQEKFNPLVEQSFSSLVEKMEVPETCIPIQDPKEVYADYQAVVLPQLPKVKKDLVGGELITSIELGAGLYLGCQQASLERALFNSPMAFNNYEELRSVLESQAGKDWIAQLNNQPSAQEYFGTRVFKPGEEIPRITEDISANMVEGSLSNYERDQALLKWMKDNHLTAAVVMDRNVTNLLLKTIGRVRLGFRELRLDGVDLHPGNENKIGLRLHGEKNQWITDNWVTNVSFDANGYSALEGGHLVPYVNRDLATGLPLIQLTPDDWAVDKLMNREKILRDFQQKFLLPNADGGDFQVKGSGIPKPAQSLLVGDSNQLQIAVHPAGVLQEIDQIQWLRQWSDSNLVPVEIKSFGQYVVIGYGPLKEN